MSRNEAPAGEWAMSPPSEALVELLRSLELTINRRLDGVLHGNHRGLTPGHGSEPGESRPYQPGDDVRRIDWNVTARTNETYVREQIADHDLTAWLVVDASATMQFGTVRNDKAQIAMAAAAFTPGLQFETLRDFGFGGPTGIELPGEAAGTLRRPESWTSMSFSSPPR